MAANDRIHNFKQKLQSWKTSVRHHEFDSLSTLRKDFSDEVRGDTGFFDTA